MKKTHILRKSAGFAGRSIAFGTVFWGATIAGTYYGLKSSGGDVIAGTAYGAGVAFFILGYLAGKDRMVETTGEAIAKGYRKLRRR